MSSKTKVDTTTGTSCPSKACTKCGEVKGLEEFHKRADSPGGLRSLCKACARARLRMWQKANPAKERARLLMYKYGITVEQYEAMLKAQGGVCKICCKSCKTGRRLAVDHVKGSDPPQIRGLLCQMHNTGIGHFNHDVELLESAIRYLNDTAH